MGVYEDRGRFNFILIENRGVTMSLIKWDNTFSVNDDKLDVQHKKWIDIINNLHDSFTNGDAIDYHNVAEESVKAMMDYVRFHFDEEEEYMRNLNYPGLSSHIEIHAKFYAQTQSVFNDVMGGELVLNTEIMNKLIDWLQDHVLKEDKKYSMFAARKSLELISEN